MRAWPAPALPAPAVTGPRVRLHDTITASVVDAMPEGDAATLYVCGITPYDATHLGHANTYVSFDLLNRAWRNAGLKVMYAQNVTDVDDPLLERATATGVDWRELATGQIDLFRTDMTALRVLPPEHYVGVVESVDLIAAGVERLVEVGATYPVTGEFGDDIYFDVDSDDNFFPYSPYDRATMDALFAARGGDPARPGKRHPMDALLWRAERPGEPAWETPVGRGRPGWHIECSVIAQHHLGSSITVQGGGADLIFPHHAFSASHAEVAHPGTHFALHYVHAGMVAYDGAKMSKSLGNLVLVSKLRLAGVDPMAIRHALLSHHYRTDWEWKDAELERAEAALGRLRQAVASGAGAPSEPVVVGVLAALAEDLDAPRALDLLTEWAALTEAGDHSDPVAGAAIATVVDAALGIKL